MTYTRGNKHQESIVIHWVDVSKVRVSGPKALATKALLSLFLLSSALFRVPILITLTPPNPINTQIDLQKQKPLCVNLHQLAKSAVVF